MPSFCQIAPLASTFEAMPPSVDVVKLRWDLREINIFKVRRSPEKQISAHSSLSLLGELLAAVVWWCNY